jgi:toxin-antitoxin system PIN domain toxin
LIALPDVNVLLALAWRSHLHHDAAHAWFQRAAGDGWATCLLTQTAFLRLSMNTHVVHVATDCNAARELLVDLTRHPDHRFLPDSPPLTAHLFDPLVPRIQGYRQMTDATLLLFARASAVKLVTFDQSVAALCPWPDSIEILNG